MGYVINGVRHQRVFNIFEDICAIPHGSGNEAAVAQYIVNYAKDKGCEAIIDSDNNVFVKKPAPAGCEDNEAILLQGHTDMVCEKNADTVHDFMRDGLKLFVKDGKIGAEGTTLGADNGIAVAYMLSLLSEDTKYPLELLFTVCEETGLEGAKSFDVSHIKAKKMINLDSEEDNVVTAGCAGGIRTNITLDLEYVGKADGVKVKICGLAGGHSGAEINSGKSSAVSLMGRLLAMLDADCNIKLSGVECNGKDNAIARECVSYVAGDIDAISSACAKFEAETKKELAAVDAGFKVEVTEIGKINILSPECKDKVVSLLACARCGVLKMSNDIAGLVEYSRNLGTIRCSHEKLEFIFSSRSSIEAQLDASIREMDALARALGAKCAHYERYPGWEYKAVSPLRDAYVEAYRGLFGDMPTVGVIHAGLECGIISDKLCGDIDIISVGPNLSDIHSPSERADIASCQRIYDILLSMLCK